MFGSFRRLVVLFALPWLTVVAIAQSASLPESDDGRQWLNARSPATSPLAAASRANALNQNDAAKKLLRQIIRWAPRSPEAAEAHKLLSRIYLRTGQYRRATDNLDEWRRDFPNSADAQAELRDVDQFRGLPDQINGQRRTAVLKHEGDLAIPLSVNGKECTFLIDTGAGVSIITQEGAERLGLEFRGAGRVIGDSSGNGFAAKTAVAKELVLGNTRLRNVSFFVVPDDQGPFTSMPLDQRGILGVPIQFAVGTWQWSKSGTVRVGEKLPPGRIQSNLTFFRNKTLVSADIAGRSAFFTLDSGAVDTDLNSDFAASFGNLVANAQRTTREVTGVGGTSTFEALILPELKLSVAGRLLTLRPAAVTLQKMPAIGGECCVGNFGDDLLFQTEGFSLDFDNMSLQFH